MSARKPEADVQEVRIELFRGLYDGGSGRSARPIPAGRSSPVARRSAAVSERPIRRGPALLNPGCCDDDATVRRFALLEIE